jgi:hypothetical protein
MSIPVLQSQKKRRRAKAEKSDLEVWDESENDIIGMSLRNVNVDTQAQYCCIRGIESTLDFSSL